MVPCLQKEACLDATYGCLYSPPHLFLSLVSFYLISSVIIAHLLALLACDLSPSTRIQVPGVQGPSQFSSPSCFLRAWEVTWYRAGLNQYLGNE